MLEHMRDIGLQAGRRPCIARLGQQAGKFAIGATVAGEQRHVAGPVCEMPGGDFGLCGMVDDRAQL